MSVVAVVKKGKDVILASDTVMTFGSNKSCPGNVKISKVRRIGVALLASTGWGLYDNILTDYLDRKKTVRLNSEKEVFRFFLGLWDALHKKYPFVKDQCEENDSPFGDLDASFLVVTKKRIFYVASDTSVTEFHKFHAIGSGCDFAIGAMGVLYEQKLKAKDIAYKAVETAIEHNIYCGGDLEIMKT